MSSNNNSAGIQIEVNTIELKALLHLIADSNKTLPPHRQMVPFIQSAPGVGKSSVIDQFAKETERHFTDIRLAYSAPTDVRGFPIVTDQGTMAFAPPADYPRDPHGVLLLDEISVAPRQTAAAALQLVLDKKVGDYKLPDDTLLILAGNRAKDRTGAERMGSALINRVIQITLRADPGVWCDWAMMNGIDSRVVAYLKFSPQELSTFDAAKWNGEDGFASPRSWEVVSNLMKGGMDRADRSLRLAAVQGSVGQGSGAQFNAFIDTYLKLPDIDAMIAAPTKGKIPTDEPDILLTMTAAISMKTTKANIGNVITLTDRFPKEYQILCLKMVLKSERSEAMRTPEAIKWLQDNAKNLGC